MDDSVGMLVEYEGKFLILLRTNDEFWECPKGHIEEDESHRETIKRELMEECKLKEFAVKDKIGELVFSFISKKTGKHKTRIITYYHIISHTNLIEISEEHQACLWVGQEDFLAKLKFDDIKNLLKEYFDKIQIR